MHIGIDCHYKDKGSPSVVYWGLTVKKVGGVIINGHFLDVTSHLIKSPVRNSLKFFLRTAQSVGSLHNDYYEIRQIHIPSF